MKHPISPAPDVFGQALTDYYEQRQHEPLLLYTNDRPEVEVMPVDLFFREDEDFPEQEQIALALCDGKVLDVGAGAGSHALSLQARGFDVSALEISALACDVMAKRGVHNIIHADIFSYTPQEKYDTLLFVMNGIGLAQTIDGLITLFKRCESLLKPGGQLLFDSSDIAYFYIEGLPDRSAYYGEIQFQYEYKHQKGAPFGWLYIDQNELIRLGHQYGWVVQILDEDDHFQYLARMERRLSF